MNLEEMFNSVSRFNAQLIGIDMPAQPKVLVGERKLWAVAALTEEVREFEEALTLEEQADALLDLMYFVLGRCYEMGIPIGQSFSDIHDANMTKVRGQLLKRPGSLGHDAVKPEGFQPPTHENLHKWRTHHIEAAEAYEQMPQVFKEIQELANRKAQDYNRGSVKRSDYFPFGQLSYAQMIWTKCLRVRSLTENQGNPNFESLRDTYVDLINYARFAVEALDQAND